jgi:hypothetical protein
MRHAPSRPAAGHHFWAAPVRRKREIPAVDELNTEH